MSVINWTQHREPFRSMGAEFAAECEAICSGRAPPLPTQKPLSDIGHRLFTARAHRAMTQAEVGKMVECDRGHIGRIELGQVKPGPELRARIEAFIDGRLTGTPE